MYEKIFFLNFCKYFFYLLTSKKLFNLIAPEKIEHHTLYDNDNSGEILNSQTTYELETDVWTLWHDVYTFLSGKPPFDSTLDKRFLGAYEMPKHLSNEAKDLIKCLLQKNCEDRIHFYSKNYCLLIFLFYKVLINSFLWFTYRYLRTSFHEKLLTRYALKNLF